LLKKVLFDLIDILSDQATNAYFYITVVQVLQ